MQEREVDVKGRIALIAFLFLVTSTFGFLQPFVPLYFESAGLSYLQIGLAMGIATGIALLIQPLWGRLSDILDTRRPFILLNGLFTGTAFLSFPHVKGLIPFMLLYALGQCGIIYLNSVGGVLVGRMVQKHHGGSAYANFRLWGSIGYILMTLTVGLVLNPGGHKLALSMLDRAFSTVPFLFYFIAILAFLVPDFRKDTAGMHAEKAPLPANLKWFLLCNALYNFALYGASSYLSIYMKSLGGSALWVTMMFAGGVVCEVLVLRQSGRFSDIYGRRPLLVFTFALLPIRLLLYIACFAPLGVFLVQILHGLNFGIMGAIAIVLINDLASDSNRGQAQARLAVSSGIASTFSPVILGLASQFLGLRAMFAVAACFALAGFFILLFKVKETHPAAQPLTTRGPERLRWLMRLLEAPPSRS